MKKLMAVSMAVILSLSLAACGGSSSKSEQSTDGEVASEGTQYELRLGHVASPTNPYAIAAEAAAEAVYERTNGAVKITVYPSSQLGGQRAMVENVMNGVQDIVMASCSTLASWDPNAGVVDIPFLFENSEHAYAVMDDEELRGEMFGKVEGTVGHIMAIYDQGWRQLISKKPILSPDDSKGLKMRVMESDAFQEMARCIGASPVPMGYSECFSSLQQGVFDFMDNSTNACYTDGFYEVAPNITLTYHTYAPSLVICSNMLEDKIGSENYKILCDTFAEYTEFARNTSVEDDVNTIKALEENGAEVHELTDEERAVFVEACEPVFEKMSQTIDAELIEKIRNYEY